METKLCTHCGKIKLRSEFYSKHDKNRPNAVKSRCKMCESSYRNYRYGRIGRVKFLRNNIISDGCVVCGENELCCLHLHHLDPSTKEYEFSNLVNTGKEQDFVREIAKGVAVLCANCHAKVHAGIIELQSTP